MIKHLHLFALALLFAACSGSGTKENQQTETTSTDESSAPAAEQTAQQVEVTVRATGNTMQEMTYDKEEIKVPAGSTVKVTLVNEGENAAMIHNIIFVYEGTMEATANAALQAGIDKEYVPDSPTIVAASPLAQPGETVTFEFEAPEAGTYEFFCSYPGHWQIMNGKLIVEDPNA